MDIIHGSTGLRRATADGTHGASEYGEATDGDGEAMAGVTDTAGVTTSIHSEGRQEWAQMVRSNAQIEEET